MSDQDDDQARFVHVPLPHNPTADDIEAFVEGIRRLARESERARAAEQAPDDKSGADKSDSE